MVQDSVHPQYEMRCPVLEGMTKRNTLDLLLATDMNPDKAENPKMALKESRKEHQTPGLAQKNLWHLPSSPLDPIHRCKLVELWEVSSADPDE